MKQILAIVATLALYVGVSAVAYGQAAPYPPNPAYINASLAPIFPYRGTYYDPKQPGTGLQVDVGATGNAFVTYYSYDANGNTAWYIVQAPYQPSDEATRWTTGVIGTLTGPFYQAKHGQCLGCPYTPTGGAEVSPFTANLVWVNSREVKMTVGPQQWDFIAPNLDGLTDGDYLTGSWVVAATSNYTGYPKTATSTSSGAINLVPNTTPVVLGEGADPAVAIPASAKTYVAVCGIPVPSTVGLPTVVPRNFNLFCDETIAGIVGEVDIGSSDISMVGVVPLFWYDKATNRMGLEAALRQIVDGRSVLAIGPRNLHYDLYLEGPDSILGRGIVENPFYPNPYNVDGMLNAGIVMTKVPGPVAEM
ncbi:hypothetical protein [Rudaea sp.]|uniref:hypothetical protein n=1 Tax=Rudaea sp. TaxID=2136325 RepID=UPI003784180A